MIMASLKMAEKFGLSLTHNRLKVQKLQDVVNFYTEKFGMKQLCCTNSKESSEEICFLGFTGEAGQKYSKSVTLFELVSPMSKNESSSSVNVNVDRDEVYWKIGVNMPDVDKAVAKLSEANVLVGKPNQFLDIGYLTHLQDPDSYSIELLQFYFKGRKKTYEELDCHPLGQQPVFGMVTLRVKDIEESLRFYRDILGMKLLCKENVSMYGFYLYFLAFTDDNPPNDDINAEENREWTYQRKCTVIELQAYEQPPNNLHFNEVGPSQFGFLGLGMGTTAITELKEHLHSNNVASSDIQTNQVFSTQCFTAEDPDGIPIRFIQF